MPTRTFKRSYRLPILLVSLAAAAAAGMIAFGYYTGSGGVSETAERVVTPPAPATIDAGAVITEPLESAETGTIEIDSVPEGADVYFDGKHKGVTPLRFEDVSPGVHLVRLEKTNYASLEAQKKVRAGYNETFFGALAPKRSGRRSKVKRTKPATRAEPRPTTFKPKPLELIDPDVAPRPRPRPKPKSGDSDHKPNPFAN